MYLAHVFLFFHWTLLKNMGSLSADETGFQPRTLCFVMTRNSTVVTHHINKIFSRFRNHLCSTTRTATTDLLLLPSFRVFGCLRVRPLTGSNHSTLLRWIMLSLLSPPRSWVWLRWRSMWAALPGPLRKPLLIEQGWMLVPLRVRLATPSPTSAPSSPVCHLDLGSDLVEPRFDPCPPTTLPEIDVN